MDCFRFTERGTLWEYVVLTVVPCSGGITLHCLTWIPEDGAFVGISATSRPMTAAQRKMYRKVLPP